MWPRWSGQLSKSAKCTNCRGDHLATSKDCPVWKKEKEVQKVKTENRLSYPEVRRLVEATSPSPTPRTYAAVAKPSTRTVDCQTKLTWLDRDKPQRSGPVKSPVAAPASNSTTTVKQQCSETQTDQSLNNQSLIQSPNRNVPCGKPQPGAGAVGSQSKPKKNLRLIGSPKALVTLLRRPIGICVSRTTPGT